MESKKVKEIKKVLEEGQFNTITHHQKEGKPIKISFADILTLINELEHENERLTEEKNLYKSQFNELEPRFFDLRNDNKELKDRIAELEKERTQQCIDCIEWRGANEKLKQFAERLKKEIKAIAEWYDDHIDKTYNGITEKDIDETLKEFLK